MEISLNPKNLKKSFIQNDNIFTSNIGDFKIRIYIFLNPLILPF